MREDNGSMDSGLGERNGWMNLSRSQGDRGWETPIVRDGSGEAIGASFFLTVDDLDDLGVEADSASNIYYRITAGGRIELSNIEDNGQVRDSECTNHTLIYLFCRECDEIEKMRIVDASQDSHQVQRVIDMYSKRVS